VAGEDGTVLRIATIYPELLGTYGDGGNALVLVERARRRGHLAETVRVALGDPLPSAQIYLLGGGEDGPQRQATEALSADGSLASRLADGAQVLAVCAGLQILGTRFAVAGGGEQEGLGLVDLETRRGERRAVGELLVRVGSQQLVGFENHGGVSALGDSSPLGSVEVGYGNDGSTDGVRAGGLIGTYAHGPVLALNPWLADELLSAALGASLAPLEGPADRLHQERCRRVAQGARRRP
jgi:CobQ-like glutamine amidotransferase family enzyme